MDSWNIYYRKVHLSNRLEDFKKLEMYSKYYCKYFCNKSQEVHTEKKSSRTEECVSTDDRTLRIRYARIPFIFQESDL